MGLLFRGIVWFGLYLLLALLPLGVALLSAEPPERPFPVELSVGVGLLAFALLAMQFTLVTRLKAASLPFGTDALTQFHRQLGIAAVAFALLHPLLLAGHGVGLSDWQPFTGSAVSRTGAAALWLALLILVTSLARRRLRLSYEAWNAIHLTAAVAVVGAMVWHVLAASGHADAGAVRWLLAAYAVLVGALLLRYRLFRPALLARQPWLVTGNRNEGADTRTLRLAPVEHPGFAFEPGQFAWLLTGRGPLLAAQHPITISSSAERPGELEFSIKALGDWSSTVVPTLAPGDRLWVDGPYGVFTPDRVPGQGLFLIAGGIGISPMRSILRTMRDREDRRPVVLLYAANSPDRAPYLDELESLSGELALTVVHVWERPPPGWAGERGFIDRAMLERHLPAHWRHYQHFVCGPVPMTDAVERALAAIGVPAGRIHSERFNLV